MQYSIVVPSCSHIFPWLAQVNLHWLWGRISWKMAGSGASSLISWETVAIEKQRQVLEYCKSFNKCTLWWDWPLTPSCQFRKYQKYRRNFEKKIKTCTSQFVIPPLMYWFSTQSIDLGSLIGGILYQGYGIGSQQQHWNLEALGTLQELQHQTCHRA